MNRWLRCLLGAARGAALALPPLACASYEPASLPKGLLGLEAAVEEEPAARGWFGAEVAPNESDSLEELEIRPGVLVVKIAGGSPAEKAGLRVGDVLLSFDGTNTDDPERLESLLRGIGAAKTVPVQFERGTQVLENEAQIELREASGGARPLYYVERGLVRAAFRNTRDGAALPEIAHLAADSPLRAAGAREGDLVTAFQGTDPGSAAELVRRLHLELEPGEEAGLQVRHADGRVEDLRFQAWQPERVLVESGFWPLWSWDYQPQEDRETLVLGDFFLFSLFKKTRLGAERHYSILSLIKWKTGEALLPGSLVPEPAPQAEKSAT